MKRNLKVKNKNLKANISLLVILVLLASSVIALLSINQIQRLITYGNMTFNYFRAYYLAKAWTELGLTEVYNRENGFDHTILSWDSIIEKNLVGNYTWFSPYFEMEIKSNFKNITNNIRYTDECKDEDKVVLWTWEWVVLALFKDQTSWIDKIMWNGSDITAINNDNINSLTFDVDSPWSFTFWLFAFDKNENMTDVVVKEWSSLSKFLRENSVEWDHKYLTIKNSWNEDAKFCITMNRKEIPYSNSLITVKANYWDMEVGLQSIVKKSVPSWSLDVLWTN